MVAIPKQSNTTATTAVIGIIAGVGVFIIVMAVLSASGMRPFGEQTILEQIDHEDSALCSKFGIAAATPKFSDCLIDLAALRQRHVDMLTGWGWL
jgi:hypothetical protein